MNLVQRIVDGRTDLVFQYVQKGQGGAAVDDGGVPLIQWCAYYGDVSAIRFLQSQGASLDLLGENLGLHAAAFHGHWQLCQFLLESGAAVNYPLAETGETPLHAALCKANRPSSDHLVQLLIAHGGEPNCATRPGARTSAFMRDVRTRGETPLHRAAAFGSELAVQMLIDAGAIVDAPDAHGETPLAWASWHLRPASLLRRLCYGSFSLHPQANWTGDHGNGVSGLDVHLLGKPHTP